MNQEHLYFAGLKEFERVRRLDVDPLTRCEIFATLARINTLYMIAAAGSGHIGSSFSSLDIVTWLYLNEVDFENSENPRSVYFSSKGHDVPGLYAVLTALGVLPFDKVHQLRRLGGLPGHPDIQTPGIATNTGSLGMGISKAKGMALARRLQGRPGRFFVMLGDGELQEGQIWESLASAANSGLGEITVIVDHNKMQSDFWVESTSSLGNLEGKFEAFGWRVARCDGHDFSGLRGCLENWRLEDLAQSEEPLRPKVLIADTIKGRGVSFMEPTAMAPGDKLYRFHSGAPDAEVYVRALKELVGQADQLFLDLGEESLQLESCRRSRVVPQRRQQRLVEAYSRALVEQGSRRDDLVVLDADLLLDCGLIPFRDTFPERFVECGIAEQDMVSQAGGLASEGLLPVVHSFACFLSTRANEQIYNNATEKTRIIYVGSLAGLVPAGPGHSHQSVRDVSVLSAVPGLRLIEPCCEHEVGLALDYAVNHNPGSTYLRLVSIPCEVPFELPEDYELVEGRGVVLRQGKEVLMIAYGPVLLAQAVLAAKEFERITGIRPTVVNLPWLNHVDEAWFNEMISEYRVMLSLDNHYSAGGQGEVLASCMGRSQLASSVSVSTIGLEEIPACGLNPEVLRYHQIDAESLVQELLNLV